MREHKKREYKATVELSVPFDPNKPVVLYEIDDDSPIHLEGKNLEDFLQKLLDLFTKEGFSDCYIASKEVMLYD